MNLHMPQHPEAETELKNLAAVPYQIVSPANNSPIIGIYQDSMLGSYRFTRENIDFTQKDAMNLLMMFNRINPTKINNLELLCNHILSYDDDLQNDIEKINEIFIHYFVQL